MFNMYGVGKLTRICQLCNKEIETGDLIGHMRFKRVLVHQKCLTKNKESKS